MQPLGDFIRYFFNPFPGPMTNTFLVIAIVLALLIFGASIGLRIILKNKKEDKIFRKMFRSLPRKMQTVAILLGLYILARYLNMPYITIRFLMYILLGVEVYLIYKYAKVYLQEYPEMKERHAKQIELNKYLPRKKKK